MTKAISDDIEPFIDRLVNDAFDEMNDFKMDVVEGYGLSRLSKGDMMGYWYLGMVDLYQDRKQQLIKKELLCQDCQRHYF